MWMEMLKQAIHTCFADEDCKWEDIHAWGTVWRTQDLRFSQWWHVFGHVIRGSGVVGDCTASNWRRHDIHGESILHAWNISEGTIMAGGATSKLRLSTLAVTVNGWVWFHGFFCCWKKKGGIRGRLFSLQSSFHGYQIRGMYQTRPPSTVIDFDDDYDARIEYLYFTDATQECTEWVIAVSQGKTLCFRCAQFSANEW